MYLKQLIITKNDGTIIRDISFKKGLNIILGVPNDGGSTNNLGKTTLMRCLNFCLGGDVSEFYADPEDKALENKAVKSFMVLNKLSFTLVLGRSLERALRSDVLIKRTILKEQKSGALTSENIINGEKYAIKAFWEKLQAKIFKTKLNKPTFRELIPKFLRRNSQETNNILRYLSGFTSDDSYSAIWFFFFGFKGASIVDERLVAIKDIADCNNKIKALNKIIPSGAKQMKALLEKELEEKIALRDAFKINENASIDEDLLNKLNQEIFNYEKYLSDLLIQLDIFHQRKRALQSDEFLEDPSVIGSIYEEMELLDISKHAQNKFEETIEFHNAMLANEILYIDSRLDGINREIHEVQDELNKSKITYNEQLDILGKEGALAQYTELNNEITKISLEGAEITSFLTKQGELQDELEALEGKKKVLDNEIDLFISNFEKKINIFNSDYFSPMTHELYGEKWLISFGASDYKFGINSLDGNPGPGKKQNIVSAFDIAYMRFIQDVRINLPYPRFATHDQVEVTDSMNLEKLKEFMGAAEGQFIFPIIFDKFESLSSEMKSDVILKLSQEEKFFKIP